MDFVCDVTFQDHVIKILHNFLLKSLSRYIAILPNLVTIGTMVVEINGFSL